MRELGEEGHMKLDKSVFVRIGSALESNHFIVNLNDLSEDVLQHSLEQVE